MKTAMLNFPDGQTRRACVHCETPVEEGASCGCLPSQVEAGEALAEAVSRFADTAACPGYLLDPLIAYQEVV